MSTDDERVDRLELAIRELASEIAELKSAMFDTNRRINKAAGVIAASDGRLNRIERAVDGYALSLPYKNYLALVIEDSFGGTEFYSLSLDMDVDPESLSGDTVYMKAIELIGHCHRRRSGRKLVEHLVNLRPRSEWQQIRLTTGE
jgi:hypothetical protein